MGFEPTTLRNLVGCSNHLSYWRLYGEQGAICGSRLEPHHAATQPSVDSMVSKGQFVGLKWLEHPTRLRRVVGSNPIWDSDFFSESSPKLISCCCCFIFNSNYWYQNLTLHFLFFIFLTILYSNNHNVQRNCFLFSLNVSNHYEFIYSI